MANGAISKLIVLAMYFSLANGWIPRLMNGRPKGGMLGAPVPTRNVKPPPEQWFDYQRLDHFDGSNVLLWKQRYFVNDEYFKPGGPIFLMIGGEGPADPIWMVEGAWVEYAKQYNAVCVMLEHRYYGKSHPVKDLSLKNLRYLSSRQALADLAYFIDYYRLMNDMKNNSLITFGGSYPGSLSAWFRSKYPYKVDGAVATSAPIFAKLAFYEYLEVVADSLDSVNPNCNTEIKNATQTMYQWVGQEEKRPILKQMFQLCDDINNTNILDLAGLFSNTAGNFEGVVQYNRDNRAFEGAVGTNITMDVLCDIMTDFTKGSAIERYAEVNSLMLKTYSEDCLDFTYKKLIEDMRKVDWASSAGEGGRQWMYQTCSEFGWFQGSESYKQPFGNWFFFPSNYSVDQCMDIYEKEFEEVIFNNVDDTNRYYGGYKLDVTKVVFPNGKVDPWHAMGVTQDLSPDATAIYIPGTAHCANMYPATPSDPPELIAARQTIAKLIGKWIS